MPDKNLDDVLMEQVTAERELGARLNAFKGQWVAVHDHHIVANAASLDDLMEQIDVEDVDAVFEVAEVDSAAWYF